jgi:hypothetical protein
MQSSLYKVFGLLVVCLALTACGGSDSSTSSVTATVTAPASMVQNTAANVSVAVAPAGQLSVNDTTPLVTVSLFDENTTNPIICNGPQSVPLNNTPVNFVCTAPAASLSSEQIHELSAEVSGQSVGSSNAIDVIYSGQVAITLSADTLNPGDTGSVNFSIETGSPIGSYEVQLPTGWNTISDNGICNISSTEPTCSITFSVPNWQP